MQIEQELKVAVERIVRPIRAAEKDKLKMREELFAHALDAFEHERSRAADREAALYQAIERLGDADATRKELQATVGWQSRAAWWNDRFVRRPAGTPLLSHAARLAFRVFVAFGLYMALLILPQRWDELLAWNYDGRLTVWFLVVINLVFSVGMFGGTIYGSLGHRLVERSLRQAGDTAKAAGLVLLTAASICVGGWLFTYAASFDAAASWSITRLWLPFSLPLATSVLLVPWLDVRERRPLTEWLELNVAE